MPLQACCGRTFLPSSSGGLYRPTYIFFCLYRPVAAKKMYVGLYIKIVSISLSFINRLSSAVSKKKGGGGVITKVEFIKCAQTCSVCQLFVTYINIMKMTNSASNFSNRMNESLVSDRPPSASKLSRGRIPLLQRRQCFTCCHTEIKRGDNNLSRPDFPADHRTQVLRLRSLALYRQSYQVQRSHVKLMKLK